MDCKLFLGTRQHTGQGVAVLGSVNGEHVTLVTAQGEKVIGVSEFSNFFSPLQRIKRTKNLYVIVGPSGSGKNTLMNSLALSGYKEVRSHTTRQQRDGEDPNSYYFISETEFMKMISAKALFEFVSYAGNYYGTSYCALEDSDFVIVEPRGARVLQTRYTERPVKIIGLNAPHAVLLHRLSMRFDNSLSRLAGDVKLFADMQQFCDFYTETEGVDNVLLEVAQFLRDQGDL